MCIERIGLGAGGRDPEEMPNVLRMAVGHAPAEGGTKADCLWVLETNLDDMTGEEVGRCTEPLLGAGALDAFTVPVQRTTHPPSALPCVLCAPARPRAMVDLLLRSEERRVG